MVSLVNVAVPPATRGTTYPSGMATLKGLISRMWRPWLPTYATSHLVPWNSSC